MATKVSTTTAPAPPPPQAVPETQHAQESPEDELTITPVHKYFYFMVELSIVRTLVERGVLDAIPLEGQVSIEELAEQTGSELALLQRFIKFLVTAEVLTSPAPGQVGHTFKSTVFVHPKAKMFLMHLFDHFMGPATRWSEYFDDNGFKEPQSSQRTPLGLFTGYPDKSLYEIMPLLPGKKVAVFNATMAENIDEMPILGYYDFSWIGKHESIKADPSRTVFVDVGGGKGQALRAVLEENPDIPRGRCVLQDQARAINESIAEDHETMRSVTKIVSSFFEPQLIKGALVYQIRRVLNDWSDNDALVILKHVADACAPDSTVIISEQLLPENPTMELVAMDIWMMNLGGKRRTRAMFEEMAAKAGLKVTSVSTDKRSGQSMVEMVPI